MTAHRWRILAAAAALAGLVPLAPGAEASRSAAPRTLTEPCRLDLGDGCPAPPEATPIDCAGPVPPFTHDHTNGASPTVVPVSEDDLVDWGGVDAQVQAVELTEQVIVFSLTIDGVTRHLTTAPFPVGGHYPSRGGGAGATSFGALALYRSEGRTDVVLRRGSSGTADAHVWRFDDPCGASAPSTTAPPTAPPSTQPPAAEPRAAAPNYTG